ncbi:DUF4248 domain-containing protein [Bacteroides sp. 214]|uniref:DUF4248 domain-containing protein n=1 Tax=Bacteroides sp. 214 TaxID=2302935 RepID=UPI0013D18275|nr:DUF4248 domain-containing protein [Bacteroides sp. 214]NDW12620.1 DUF4248 domain-containing protein [Bacteroides sp. 214]
MKHAKNQQLEAVLTEGLFTIRTYAKEELARLYSPHDCIRNALRTLYRWMRRNAQLMQELDRVGYNKYARKFTPREVELIVKYLGEP